MKETITISSFIEYYSWVESIVDNGKLIVLFRGQMCDWPLRPSVARDKVQRNSTVTETKMLKDLQRRSRTLLSCEIETEWEWLVLAQHKGMATRLLDWTSNPLTALWFACQPCDDVQDACVYIIEAGKDLEIDITVSPFASKKTRIYKPILNNELVIAQDGWFTTHYFCDTKKEFIPLADDADMKNLLTKIIIPHEFKLPILKRLSRLGINNRRIYPGLEGLCKHLTWKYLIVNPIE